MSPSVVVDDPRAQPWRVSIWTTCGDTCRPRPRTAPGRPPRRPDTVRTAAGAAAPPLRIRRGGRRSSRPPRLQLRRGAGDEWWSEAWCDADAAGPGRHRQQDGFSAYDRGRRTGAHRPSPQLGAVARTVIPRPMTRQPRGCTLSSPSPLLGADVRQEAQPWSRQRRAVERIVTRRGDAPQAPLGHRARRHRRRAGAGRLSPLRPPPCPPSFSAPALSLTGCDFFFFFFFFFFYIYKKKNRPAARDRVRGGRRSARRRTGGAGRASRGGLPGGRPARPSRRPGDARRDRGDRDRGRQRGGAGHRDGPQPARARRGARARGRGIGLGRSWCAPGSRCPRGPPAGVGVVASGPPSTATRRQPS